MLDIQKFLPIQRACDLCAHYNIPVQAWGERVITEITNRPATLLVIYNIKTNTLWFAIGFVLGTFGAAYLEKRNPAFMKKLGLLSDHSLLEQMKSLLSKQTRSTQYIVRLIAFLAIFTPYYPIEGLILGFLTGQHSLVEGRRWQQQPLLITGS